MEMVKHADHSNDLPNETWFLSDNLEPWAADSSPGLCDAASLGLFGPGQTHGPEGSIVGPN